MSWTSKKKKTKVNMQVAWCKVNRLNLGIYMYIQIHACMQYWWFKSKQRKVYVEGLEGGIEGINAVIKIYTQENK